MKPYECEVSAEEDGKRLPPKTMLFTDALRKARNMHEQGLRNIQIKTYLGKVYNETDLGLMGERRSEPEQQ